MIFEPIELCLPSSSEKDSTLFFFIRYLTIAQDAQNTKFSKKKPNFSLSSKKLFSGTTYAQIHTKTSLNTVLSQIVIEKAVLYVPMSKIKKIYPSLKKISSNLKEIEAKS